MIGEILKYSTEAKKIADIVDKGFEVDYALDPCIIFDYLHGPRLSDESDSDLNFKKDLFYKAAISMLLDSDHRFYFLKPYKLELQDILDYNQWAIRRLKNYVETNIKNNLEVVGRSINTIFRLDFGKIDQLKPEQIDIIITYLSANFYELYNLLFYLDIEDRLGKYRKIRSNTLNLKIDEDEFLKKVGTYNSNFDKIRGNPYSNLVDAQALSLLVNANKILKEEKRIIILLTHAKAMFNVLREDEELKSFTCDGISLPLVIHPYSLLIYNFCKDTIDDLVKLKNYSSGDLFGDNLEAISSEYLITEQIDYFLKTKQLENFIESNVGRESQKIVAFIASLAQNDKSIEDKLNEIRNLCVNVDHLLSEMSDKDIAEARAKKFLLTGIYLFGQEYQRREVIDLLEKITLNVKIGNIQRKIEKLKVDKVEEAYHLSAFLNEKLENYEKASEEIKLGKKLCKDNQGKKRKYDYLKSINLEQMGKFKESLALSEKNAREHPQYPRYNLHLGYQYWKKYKRDGGSAALKEAINRTEQALDKSREREMQFCHCILIGLANLVRFYIEDNNLKLAEDKLNELKDKILYFKEKKRIGEDLPLFYFVEAFLKIRQIQSIQDDEEKRIICEQIKTPVNECRRNLVIVDRHARNEYVTLIKEYEKLCKNFIC